MSQQVLTTENKITLKGSAQIVSEFFSHAVNSILYQRGVYPPESFKGKKQYGITVMVSTDAEVNKFLSNVCTQMQEWLAKGDLQQLVMVVTSAYTKEVLERWAFKVETDKEVVSGGKTVSKPDQEIKQEIQAIIRQITASVTFLPLLNDPCTFDLLFYTKNTTDTPQNWEESDARVIKDAVDVKLRAFSTKVHKVEAMVAYKQEDDADML